ncbi:hypothetical protein DdX_00019 [Ditylenchus destructor]|uniref:Uncharacterized protein n=1 Tax=Ditylenchus destructor TaxID=166010 RepID=A0AAD4RCZ3_9BILA|nr:hypothetical protein DdX_00019 [Ditylenchus destructor]
MNDGCDTETRQNAENFWIHQLVTMHPFGLNDKVTGMKGFASDMTMDKKENVKHYFSNPLPNAKHRKKPDNPCTAKNPKDKNLDIEVIDTTNAREMTQIYRNNKKSLANPIHDLVTKTVINKDVLLASHILATIKKSRNKNQQTVEKIPIYVKVDYLNPSLDKIGIRNMIHDSTIARILNIKDSNYKIVTVFNLVKNNFCRYSNYNNILRELDFEKLTDILSTDCQCSSSTHCNTDYGHVITGDTNIIECPKLSKQFENGTKHRQGFTITINKLRGILYKYGNDIVENFGRRTKMKKDTIPKIRNLVIDRLIEIGEQRWNKKIGPYDKIVNKEFVGRTGNHLQNYAITCIDKASNNFAFICKKFYLQTICHELGINVNSNITSIKGNETYICSIKNKEEIFNEYQQLYKEMDINADLTKLKIPLIFATPKFHKKPIKFRFIAGASAAVSKPLNITIVRILEVVKNNTVKYCDTIRERSGCNLYWSVNSSSQTNSMLQDMSTTAENDHLANDEQEVTTALGNGNAE